MIDVSMVKMSIDGESVKIHYDYRNKDVILTREELNGLICGLFDLDAFVYNEYEINSYDFFVEWIVANFRITRDPDSEEIVYMSIGDNENTTGYNSYPEELYSEVDSYDIDTMIEMLTEDELFFKVVCEYEGTEGYCEGREEDTGAWIGTDASVDRVELQTFYLCFGDEELDITSLLTDGCSDLLTSESFSVVEEGILENLQN